MRRFTQATCMMKVREWEIKVSTFFSMKWYAEREISRCQREQVKWRKRWREASE